MVRVHGGHRAPSLRAGAARHRQAQQGSKKKKPPYKVVLEEISEQKKLKTFVCLNTWLFLRGSLFPSEANVCGSFLSMLKLPLGSLLFQLGIRSLRTGVSNWQGTMGQRYISYQYVCKLTASFSFNIL